MAKYRVVIQKVDDEYQITIPQSIIKRLKISEGTELVIDCDNNNKVTLINSEDKHEIAFTDALKEGMDKYREALESLTDR